MQPNLFKLRFPQEKIEYYALQYSYTRSERIVVNNSEQISKRGYLTKAELQLLAEWKTPRSKWQIDLNSEEFVRDVTKIALSSHNEKLRIEILLLLKGVGWPTASCILHFNHKERYPILDFRVLYSINQEHVLPENYNYEFWQAYTDYIRRLADTSNLDMRVLDQGLWMYSKLNQKRKTETLER